MKIFTAFLRILLLLIWFKILIVSGFDIFSFEFLTWIAVVLVAIYLMIMTQFWLESIWCPMKGCNIKTKK